MNWQIIHDLQGRTFKTLGNQKPFDILEVTESHVVVRPHSTRKERPIPRKQMEGAYDEAVKVGKMRLEDIRRHSEVNPVYVAAILNTLPGFSSMRKPILIYYNQH